jgi:hypothetical protein
MIVQLQITRCSPHDCGARLAPAWLVLPVLIGSLVLIHSLMSPASPVSPATAMPKIRRRGQLLPGSVLQHKQHRWMKRAVQLEFEVWSQTTACIRAFARTPGMNHRLVEALALQRSALPP